MVAASKEQALEMFPLVAVVVVETYRMIAVMVMVIGMICIQSS